MACQVGLLKPGIGDTVAAMSALGSGSRKLNARGVAAIAVIGMVVVVAFAFGWGRSPSGSAETLPCNIDRFDAYAAAQEFVKRSIRTPATAEFPVADASGVAVTRDSGNACKFSVAGYVDAENLFGATIRSKYTLAVTLDNSGSNWHLDALSMEDQ